MRILTLVAGKNALPDAVRLTSEIRCFNAEIDFRLRFLHVEIEEAHAVSPELRADLENQIERATVREVSPEPPMEASAHLAILLVSERPDLFVVIGDGSLRAPGLAAARVSQTKFALFGTGRGSAEGAVDLGDSPPGAVDLMSGVAREIQ